MNPVFFIPFLLAPTINAIISWGVMKLDLVGKVVSVVPWTAPAPVDTAWALGWDLRTSRAGHYTDGSVVHHLSPLL